MEAAALVAEILRSDPLRWRLLSVVDTLNLPDCWIAAGFIRNAVWDHLHGRSPSPLIGDVDVIWHDPNRTAPELDREYEAQLLAQEPLVDWSVKNQARMHARNNDSRYISAEDAMCYWPETATAIAARRCGVDDCEIIAPLGFDDLINLIVRPTPRFLGAKHDIYKRRVQAKGWMEAWPDLRLA